MFRDTAAGVNARSPSPPKPIRPIAHRWPCPLCGTLHQCPSHLAVHLAAVHPNRPDHGLSEHAAFTRAAAVSPVFVGRERRTAPSSLGRLARQLDRLAARYTAARSLAELCDLGTDPANRGGGRDGGGGWTPTLHAVTGLRGVRHSRRQLTRLADAYDAAQSARGDRRRARRV